MAIVAIVAIVAFLAFEAARLPWSPVRAHDAPDVDAELPALTRPAFASPLFRLVETVEVDVSFSEGAVTLRVELFRDLERADQFRARTYEARKVPVPLAGGEEERGETAVVLLPWAVPGALVTEEPFVAASVEAALTQVLDDIRTFLLMGAVEA